MNRTYRASVLISFFILNSRFANDIKFCRMQFTLNFIFMQAAVKQEEAA